MANSLSAFLAENAKKIDNIKYAVSDRFVDENGDAIEWEVKCITAAENAELRKTCMRTVPVRGGRKGQTTQEFDSAAYTAKLAARCTVFPNLNDGELQQSYHANGADNLIVAMLTPAEFDDYTVKVMEHCGFETGEELVEEAKN